ncbi:helix-turn-helix domain-containing protein [Rhodococcus opacus]|uniref:helix-turn-helix domain-containing protein n=1 Tax=Rhodococcus opacus TaxID=37919 RepID=UPI0009B5C3AB
MTKSTTERVTTNVRAELARRGLTQRDLAQALDITQQAASRRMLGRVQFSVEDLGKVADLLGIAPEHLLADHSTAAA